MPLWSRSGPVVSQLCQGYIGKGGDRHDYYFFMYMHHLQIIMELIPYFRVIQFNRMIRFYGVTYSPSPPFKSTRLVAIPPLSAAALPPQPERSGETRPQPSVVPPPSRAPHPPLCACSLVVLPAARGAALCSVGGVDVGDVTAQSGRGQTRRMSRRVCTVF